MRSELERLQRIERQLLGQPTPAEAAQWQAQLLLDETLTDDVAAQRQLYRGICEAGRQQLRQELRQMHEQLYRPRRGWLPAAVARLRRVLSWPSRPRRR